MKGKLTLLFVFFIIFQAYTQSTQNWKIDLDTLENILLEKDYLFINISKKEFSYKLGLLNKNKTNKELNFWELSNLLKSFKIPDLKLKNIEFKRFPFKIKQFKDKYHIISIHHDYNFILGYKLTKINNVKIDKILDKTKYIDDINSVSFLKYYNFTKKDTLKLSLLSDKDEKIKINLPLSEFNDEELIRIIPKKEPFYLQKSDYWFWKYGINFGQQVYFKYNVGLSKEFLQQQKDSFKISELTLSRQYKLPLQSIYDAPEFDELTEEVFLKFKNRRYKKLFIDFRNNKTGNVKAFNNFIKNIKDNKRINKKNRLYVFVDKSASSSVIETILELKKRVRITIIGEEIKGLSCSSDEIDSFYLPNSEFKIYYPKKYFKNITLEPDVKVFTSFENYKNGVDPILQKALSL